MDLEFFSLLLAGLALMFALLAFGWRLRTFNALARPVERSLPKRDPGAGVRYAFTWGMAPWAKESTRRHWVAYLRGIAFHLGIFLGLGILLVSPWLTLIPYVWRISLAVGAGLGALFGLAGFVARLVEPNLKALSTLDDYFAVLLVSLFLATATSALLAPALRPVFYLVSALMLVYAPFGKIRHCLYYAYSRLFFGKFFGRRAVLPATHGRTAR
jgi:nitrate reductase gamma subunit